MTLIEKKCTRIKSRTADTYIFTEPISMQKGKGKSGERNHTHRLHIPPSEEQFRLPWENWARAPLLHTFAIRTGTCVDTHASLHTEEHTNRPMHTYHTNAGTCMHEHLHGHGHTHTHSHTLAQLLFSRASTSQVL